MKGCNGCKTKGTVACPNIMLCADMREVREHKMEIELSQFSDIELLEAVLKRGLIDLDDMEG